MRKEAHSRQADAFEAAFDFAKANDGVIADRLVAAIAIPREFDEYDFDTPDGETLAGYRVVSRHRRRKTLGEFFFALFE